MIKDIPILERPREKALRFGIDTLSNIELYALLLGYGGKSNSVLDIANSLFKEDYSLVRVMNLSFQELCQIKGISNAKALHLLAIQELLKRYISLINQTNKPIKQVDELVNKYVYELSSLSKEVLIIVILNQQNKIIKEKRLYSGGKKLINISIDEIILYVINSGYSKFYLIHNHPSGRLIFSKEDILATKEIIKTSKMLKLTLVDHLLISNLGYASYRNNETTYCKVVD